MSGANCRCYLLALCVVAAGCAPAVCYPVEYTVTATLGRVLNGGPDLLNLAGKPFRMTALIDSTASPSPASCSEVCVFNNQNLKLTLGPFVDFSLEEVPVTLRAGNPGMIFVTGKVIFVPMSAALRVRLAASSPRAFGTQPISADASTVTYGRSVNTTVLAIASGTVSATTTAPALSAEPRALSFSIRKGHTPAVQTVKISATSAVPFSVASPASWLNLSAASHTTNQAGTLVTVSIDPSKFTSEFDPGAGGLSILVTSSLASNSPLSIPVTVKYFPSQSRSRR